MHEDVSIEFTSDSYNPKIFGGIAETISIRMDIYSQVVVNL